MTEADLLQARFELGDAVTFPLQGASRATGLIVKLNQRTATVRHGPDSWRVPYALLELPNGQRRDSRAGRRNGRAAGLPAAERMTYFA